MTEENLERAVAAIVTIAALDKSARKRGQDTFQRAALLDQRNAALDALCNFLRENSDWYAVSKPDELPPLLSIEAAARLCGLEVGAGYYLSHNEWAPFLKTWGDRGRAVRTAGLLSWLDK